MPRVDDIPINLSISPIPDGVSPSNLPVSGSALQGAAIRVEIVSAAPGGPTYGPFQTVAVAGNTWSLNAGTIAATTQFGLLATASVSSEAQAASTRFKTA